MPDLLKNLTHTDYLLISGGFAGTAGGVSYWLKTIEGKPFMWREFFAHVLASMIFGFIAFEFASFEGIPDEFCGAIAGTAGWAGTRIARILEIVLPKILNALILKYFGLSKKDLEQKEEDA